MLKKYNNYLNESKNDMYEIECKIKEDYLLNISGQNNIKDAIKNEINWTDTMSLLEINKNGDTYILEMSIDDSIIQDTDALDIKEAIFYEFDWLKQSGIFIEKIR